MKKFSFIVIIHFLFLSHASANFQLRDIGIIGLMSHDIFTWDHKQEINLENGRLDLSTIFDYENGERWAKGGNPKNSENAPVYTITMTLVNYYKDKVKEGYSPVDARKATVVLFHEMLEECYTRVFESPYPTVAINETPTNTEQAALRALHDILPGKVQLFDRTFRSELTLTNAFFAKTFLNEKELLQPIKNFDGDYDAEYKNIKIPFSGVTLNLKEIDKKFIESFSPYKQDEMLAELARVGQNELHLTEVSFIHHIPEMLSKALCSTDNEWIPPTLTCQ